MHINTRTSILIGTILGFAAPSVSAVCDSGIYATLTPLKTYAPAQSYCSTHYPAKTATVTVTVTEGGLQRRVPAATKSTAVSSTSTTKITTTTKSSTTTKAQDPNASLLSALSSAAASIAQTFCSCIQSSVTVTVSSTTSLTTTTALSCPAPTSSPPGAIRCCNSNDCPANEPTCEYRRDGGNFCSYYEDDSSLPACGSTVNCCATDSDCASLNGGRAFCAAYDGDTYKYCAYY